MKKIIITILIIILNSSCNNIKAISNDIEKLKSKAIVIPKDHKMMIFNNDSTNTLTYNEQLKLVIYYNSESCSSCALKKLYLWKDYIQLAKSHKGLLQNYFIFNPKHSDLNSLKLYLLSSSIDCPVIVDTLGEFEKLNTHLPDNQMMHTFLLDQDNKVILVGNPIMSSRIEKLLTKEINDRLEKL